MKARWSVRALAVVGVISAALIAAGCGSSEGGGASDGKTAPKAEQILRYMVTADPEGLDPAATFDVSTLNMLTSMFVGLYRLQGENSEVTPYLAKSMPEVSDDGLTYTIEMRDDATWTNGDPVTAEDVVFGVKHALMPSTKAQFASFMSSIVGACEVIADGDKDALKDCGDNPTDGSLDKVGVAALNDHTVEFKLRRPVPWFNQLLTVSTFWPLPQATVEKFGDKWTDPKNIVTNGPFTLESFKRGKELVVTRNADFFLADDVKLEKLIFTVVGDPKTALKKFELGELDAGVPITPATIDKWKARPEYQDSDSSSVTYVYFNTTNEAIKDPKVRQGISMAIDRSSIIKNIRKRGDKELSTIIPSVLPGYDTIKEGTQDFLGDSEPNVEKAKELLKQGGWRKDTELTFYYASGSPSAAVIAQSIQSDLAKVDVKVKVVPIPDNIWYEAGISLSPISKKVDMQLSGWSADYFDAQDYYQLFTCDMIDDQNNAANFCDSDFDTLYKEALDTVDDDARIGIYRQLESMLTGPDGMMPAVPLYQPKDVELVQTWVKGYQKIPSAWAFYDGISINEH